MKKVAKVLIGVLVVVGVIAVLQGKDSKYEKQDNKQVTEQKETKEKSKVYKVGDKVGNDKVSITLKEVKTIKKTEYSKPENGMVFVGFKFTVENKSNEDLTVSSILGFEAYADDELLEQYIVMGDNEKQLDVTISSGKKATGIVYYQAPKGFKKLNIEYKPEFWDSDKIVYEYTK